MVLAPNRPLDSARFQPGTRHRLEAYAKLLPGGSSDLSKCFVTAVPRAHSDIFPSVESRAESLAPAEERTLTLQEVRRGRLTGRENILHLE
jgi:hypothetical protein